MKPYTKKQYKEDFDILQEFKAEFVQAVKDLIPLQIHYAVPEKNPIIYPTQMFYVSMDPKPFRHPICEFYSKGLAKDLVTGNLFTSIFISTEINSNGIDSTGRIGRTWVISFETSAPVRYYRCKRIWGCTLSKFYSYAESPSKMIKEFVTWYKSEYPSVLKEKMIEVPKSPYETWVRFKKLSKVDQIKLLQKDYLESDVKGIRRYLLEDGSGGPLVDPVSLTIMEF